MRRKKRLELQKKQSQKVNLEDFHYRKDPCRVREKKKYVNAVVSREYILQYLGAVNKVVHARDIIKAMGLKKDMIDGLYVRLGAMVRDFQIIQTKPGCYQLPSKDSVFEGVIGATRRGYFVKSCKTQEQFVLNRRQSRAFFPKDRVKVALMGFTPRGERKVRITEVVEHHTHSLIGQYTIGKQFNYVLPQNPLLDHHITIFGSCLLMIRDDDMMI